MKNATEMFKFEIRNLEFGIDSTNIVIPSVMS